MSIQATHDARKRTQFLLALVLSVSIMVVDHQTPLLQMLRPLLIELITPLETVARVPNHLAKWFEQTLHRDEDILATNAQLQGQVQLLKAQLSLLEHVKLENQVMTKLLATGSSVGQWQVVVAKVSDSRPSIRRQMFQLSKGSTDGLAPGNVVIHDRYLVGQITQVRRHSATVTQLTDPQQLVPVMNPRTGEKAFVRGNHRHSLILDYLVTDADLKMNDEWVTSGEGDRYPAGLIVGQVDGIDEEKTQNRASVFVTATVKPSVPRLTFDYVSVLVPTATTTMTEEAAP